MSKKHIIISIVLLILFGLTAFFLTKQSQPNARFPFQFGLDLVGGVELVYKADTTNIEDIDGAMETLKEVMERRVNVFGVSEPIIQIERSGLISGNQDNQLIIELPGYKNVDEAKR